MADGWNLTFAIHCYCLGVVVRLTDDMTPKNIVAPYAGGHSGEWQRANRVGGPRSNELAFPEPEYGGPEATGWDDRPERHSDPIGSRRQPDRAGRSGRDALDDRPRQMPVKEWHGFINDPALADALLDRLVHSSMRIALKGESVRKLKSGNAQ